MMLSTSSIAPASYLASAVVRECSAYLSAILAHEDVSEKCMEGGRDAMLFEERAAGKDPQYSSEDYRKHTGDSAVLVIDNGKQPKCEFA